MVICNRGEIEMRLKIAMLLLAASYMPIAVAQGAAAGATLEEVVVTAEKRTENVQKTSISITAISGEEMRKRAENQLDTMLRNVPSLQIQGTPQGGEIYIRGVGANGDSNFVDPSVALSLDGVYTARSERLSAGLYDISRAEVLRGPQGTIYGRNADGGSVNIISNAPVIGSYQSRANLQTGNYALKHFDASQNIAAGSRLAFRVAVLKEDRDGYFSNDGYASHVQAGRVKALLNATDNWTLQATVDYSRQKGNATTTVPIAGPFGGGPPPLLNALPNGWPTNPSDPWFVDQYHPADIIDYKFVTSSIQSDVKLDWGTLTFIPTWTSSSRYVLSDLVVGNFFGPISPMGASPTISETQKTGELRLTSPESSLMKWVLGYYYLWSDNGGTGSGVATTTVSTCPPGPPPPGCIPSLALYTTDNAGASPTTSKAPFGQLTFPVNDQLRVVAGLRHTQDTKSQASRITSVAIPGYNSGLVKYDASFSSTTYKAGVEYDVRPQSMLYAQYSTGYKAGGFDTTASPPKSYKPEHVKSYEFGSKNRFLGDRLQVNGAIYYYDYTDLQVQYAFGNGVYPIPAAFIPAGVNNSTFQQYIANAGKGVNKGAEIEVSYRFTAHDQLDISATYTDAHYGNFNKLTDPNLSLDSSGNIALNGKVIAATPKSTGTINYEHDWTLGSGTLTAQVSTKLSSSYDGSVNNRGFRPGAFQKAYSRSDASLVYDNAGKWSVSAWVKNIENKAQIQFGDFPLNRNVISFPRTVGANLSVTFR
jgi:iron complex outermembrane receptor protein